MKGCIFVDAALPARVGLTDAVAPALLDIVRRTAEGCCPGRTASTIPTSPRSSQARETIQAIGAEQPRPPLSFFEQHIPAPAD